MVCGLTAGEYANVLPYKSWINAHFVYFFAYPLIPFGFHEFNKALIAFVNFFQLGLEVGDFVWTEVSSVVEAVA